MGQDTSFAIMQKTLMIRRYLPKNTEELIRWYERYVSPIALVFGFLLDSFILLDRVDVLFGNLLLLTYLMLTGVGIVVLNVVASGRVQNPLILRVAPFMPVIIQFFFGALFSGYLSLYARSAGIALSWFFVGILAFLLIGNERFRERYLQLPFQLAVYFTTIFSFLIFFLPLITKRIGTPMFLLSGLASLFCVGVLLLVLHRLVPERVDEKRTHIARNIIGVFVVFNALYFSNLIPPLPLALKEAGVYHAVEKSGSLYRLMQEEPTWRVTYLSMPADFNIRPGEKAYVFTAIFAPTGLSTEVRHQWQWYNDETNAWETKSDVKFTIHGGRDGGFRGYSEKRDPERGSWRVNILTAQGRIIGRTSFMVRHVSDTPTLLEVEK